MIETDNTARQVGERIATARKAAGFSQRSLGKRLGISPRQVEDLEAGRSDPSGHVEQLAEITRRSIHWLQTGSDETIPAALGARINEARQATETTESGDEDALRADTDADEPDEPAEPAEPDEPDEPDELDRLFSALRQQSDEIKRRLDELDQRDQDLQVRESLVGAREDLIKLRQDDFEREWESRLRELEELHRSVAESASAFAKRAAALRQNRVNADDDLAGELREEHQDSRV